MADSPVVPEGADARPGVAPVVSQHAWQRLYERLMPAEQPLVSQRIAALEQVCWKFRGKDFGIRLLRLGEQRGDAWSDRSNGDEVWAIVRDGDIKTVMLRRSSQPATAWALRVDALVLLS